MDTALSVDDIISRAASATLKGAKVKEVHSEPAIGAYGHEILRVTLVFEPIGEEEITGDNALDTIAQIQYDLQSNGEDRFAVVSFAREGEPDVDDDTES